MMNSVIRPFSYFPVQTSWKLLIGNCPQSSAVIVPLRKKHYDPKFRRERGRKVLKVDLPDFDEIRENEKLSVEEIRQKLKEKGIVPRRKWTEKPMCVSCTGGVFDPYVPPEGDGKMTLASKPGIKQKSEEWGKKSKSYLTLRKVRDFQYDFDVPQLAEKCQQIYIAAHETLETMDEDKLHELVTERCYPEMVDNTKLKTIRWKFIESLEFPRVVHMRHESFMKKEDIFAQATVRFHTRQTLAIYDRFGRLMHGSENTVKDVLEYVVFERQLSDQYSTWRIHAKIIPEWRPPRDSILKTFVKSE